MYSNLLFPNLQELFLYIHYKRFNTEKGSVKVIRIARHVPVLVYE
jgi:hypothetical protein